MKIRILLAALLLAAPAFGQSIWPASKVQFADALTLENERDRERTFSFGSLPTCNGAAIGNVFTINDALDAASCAAGGTSFVECGCDGSIYQPLSGGGDNIFIQGVAAVNPDFRNEGDLTPIRCTAPTAPDADCVAAEDVIYRYNALSIVDADISPSAAILGTKMIVADLGQRGSVRRAAQIEVDTGIDVFPFVSPATLERRALDNDLGGTIGTPTVLSVQALVAGPGLGITAGLLETASDEQGFLFDNDAVTLTCGASNNGKIVVHNIEPLQYCDGNAIPLKRFAADADATGDAFGVGTGAVAEIKDIVTHIKTGDDGTLVTGTAGGTGLCAEWNIDGDLVEAASAAACGSGGPAANLTTPGIIEIATGAETNTGTDATRAVSPDGLDDWTGSTALAAGTETLTNKTLDVEATGNVVTVVDEKWYDFVGCPAATAALSWDTEASLTTPAIQCVDNGATTQGQADFDDATAEGFQRLFKLPSSWTGNIDIDLYWRGVNTTLDVCWVVQTACTAVGEVWDTTFTATGAADTVSDTAAGTTLQINVASFTGITTTGCAAGELMHLLVKRDGAEADTNCAAGSDDFVGDALGVGLEITMRRAL